MGAAIEGAVRLDAVADDLAPAMLAHRGELMDGALEAVEGVGMSRGDHLKGEIVVVAADFTDCHGILPRRGGRCRRPRKLPSGMTNFIHFLQRDRD
jgi:hypothetical protein